jgi:hypothetical protein
MNLIFISGLVKSGTTYLSNILGSLPKMDKKHEGHFFNKPVGNRYDSLWNCLQNIEPWFSSQVFNMGGWILQKDENMEELTIKKYKSMLDWLIAEQIRRTIQFLSNPERITIEKMPVTEIGSIKALRYCFPQEKVIWMVRNFFDWLISNVFFYFKLAPKVGLEHIWFDMNDYVQVNRYNRKEEKYPVKVETAKRLLEIYQSFAEVSKYNVKRVSYESLVEQPKETIEGILKYLNLTYTNDEILSALKKGENPPDLMEGFRRAGQVGEYKNYLDEDFINKVTK